MFFVEFGFVRINEDLIDVDGGNDWCDLFEREVGGWASEDGLGFILNRGDVFMRWGCSKLGS